MINFLRITLFAFLVLVLFSSKAEKIFNWETEFIKVENDYIKGDYKKALAKSQSLLKKVEKALPNQGLPKAIVLAQIAKIYEALSRFEDYSSTIELSVNNINLPFKDTNDEYAKALNHISEAYIQYGDIGKAQVMIEKAIKLIEAGSVADTVLVNDIKCRQLLVYYKQGYLVKAEAMIADLIIFRKARVVRKVAYKDTKGKLKERKLSKAEWASRVRSAAELLNLYSLITMENGNYSKTDSLLNANASYIRKNLSKKDVTYVETIFQRGLLLESLQKHSEANVKFEKAAKSSIATKGVRWRVMSKQAIRIGEKRIISHRRTKRDHQAKKREKIFGTRILRTYGKNSIYFAKGKLIKAETHVFSKDYKKAEEKVMEVLNNPEYFPKNNPERIRALKLLFNIAIETDQYLKAEGSLDQIIDITEALHGNNVPAYYKARLDLANFHVLYSSNFKKAEGIYSSSLEKIQNEVDHRSNHFLSYLYSYSDLFEYTDRFDKALEMVDITLQDTKKYYGEHHPKYAIALGRAANILIDLGKYADAEKNLNRAEEIFRNEGSKEDYEDYSHALETFARLHIIQGQYDEAKKLLKKAVQKNSFAGGEVKLSNAIEELATLYIETGKYQETERSLKESVKLKEAKYGLVHRSLVNPLNQLGHLYLITGNYIEADKFAKRAASISLQIFGESSIKFAESLKLAGNIFASIGDYEKAEEAIEKALAIQKHQYGHDHIQIAMSLNDIALIKYYNNADFKEVEGLFVQALEMIKANLGDKHPGYASILNNLASFYLETGYIEKSETLLNEANAIWVGKFGESNRHSAEIYFIKGNLSLKRGNYLQAKADYTSSRNIYQKVFDNSSHPGYLGALSKMGQMDYINGDYKSAIKSLDETTSSYLTYIQNYFPSLSEREKTKFWSTIQKDFEFYNTLAFKLKDNPVLVSNAYNFALTTKALLLNSSIKVRQTIMDSKDQDLIKKFEEWIGKKEFMTSVFSMTSEQRKESAIDLKALEVELESLEKELSARSEAFSQNFRKKKVYDWRDIRKNLGENEVAIEMVRFRYFDKSFTDKVMYAALIVSSETKSYPNVVLLENGTELEARALNYYRNCMKFNVGDNQSYDFFWKPIKDLVKDNSVIYFSPDGVYNQINIETLISQDKKYVLDQNEIILISNTRDLISQKLEIEKESKGSKSSKNNSDKINDNTIALFGNPVYYSNSFNPPADSSERLSLRHKMNEDEIKKKVPQLAGAEKEVVGLHSMLNTNGWDSEAYLSEKATEAKLKELRNIKVLHIATHGFFMEDLEVSNDQEGINKNRAVDNPLHRSGLLLKDGGYLLQNHNVFEFNSCDGILTAYEAMNLNFDHTELVVLSACETGLGKVQMGEGVYGLQRSFLVAGAKTVIMSLFKVSDEVTQELMTSFYEKWLVSGNKRQAFIDAKKGIKEKYKNPIYWGAFIMIGID